MRTHSSRPSLPAVRPVFSLASERKSEALGQAGLAAAVAVGLSADCYQKTRPGYRREAGGWYLYRLRDGVCCVERDRRTVSVRIFPREGEERSAKRIEGGKRKREGGGRKRERRRGRGN